MKRLHMTVKTIKIYKQIFSLLFEVIHIYRHKSQIVFKRNVCRHNKNIFYI